VNISISDDDVDALRRIRHARDGEPLDGVQMAALDRIIGAAERPVPEAPDAVGDRIENRAGEERTCIVCGDTCSRDLARHAVELSRVPRDIHRRPATHRAASSRAADRGAARRHSTAGQRAPDRGVRRDGSRTATSRWRSDRPRLATRQRRDPARCSRPRWCSAVAARWTGRILVPRRRSQRVSAWPAVRSRPGTARAARALLRG